MLPAPNRRRRAFLFACRLADVYDAPSGHDFKSAGRSIRRSPRSPPCFFARPAAGPGMKPFGALVIACVTSVFLVADEASRCLACAARCAANSPAAPGDQSVKPSAESSSAPSPADSDTLVPGPTDQAKEEQDLAKKNFAAVSDREPLLAEGNVGLLAVVALGQSRILCRLGKAAVRRY